MSKANTYTKSTKSITLDPGMYTVHLHTGSYQNEPDTTEMYEMKIDTENQDFGFYEKHFTVWGNYSNHADYAQFGTYTMFCRVFEQTTLYMWGLCKKAKVISCELSAVKLSD